MAPVSYTHLDVYKRQQLVNALQPEIVLRTAECYLPESAIQSLCARDLGDDPVFAFMGKYELSEFLNEHELAEQRSRLQQASSTVLVIGTGASLVAEQWDLLVYCDMARWEIQQRQRSGEVTNLGVQNCTERPQAKYKRAYFVDWRVADRLKKNLIPKFDFLLDTNQRDLPKMISGQQHLRGLKNAAHRPFRVVPFFDPGPWGGQWMKEVDVYKRQPIVIVICDREPQAFSRLVDPSPVRYLGELSTAVIMK